MAVPSLYPSSLCSSSLYPLTFVPIGKELVWGGRKLVSELGKPFPGDRRLGESWELVDLPAVQSLVAAGALAGRSLSDLVGMDREGLLGPVALAEGRFPLLVKYIDAAQILSVQVHPSSAVAARHGGRPKHEAWYVLAVEPGAKLYIGLKPGVTAVDLERALRAGDMGECAVAEAGACEEGLVRGVEALLEAIEPRPGDLVPIPPGTVHAIGGGILLAEVQQPSDTTYRLYDWGRLGLDGRPRTLHLAESLESVDYAARPRVEREEYDAGHFHIKVVRLDAGGGDAGLGHSPGAGPLVVVGLEGSARLIDAHGEEGVLARGRVVLVPHACRPARIVPTPRCEVLCVTFPPASAY